MAKANKQGQGSRGRPTRSAVYKRLLANVEELHSRFGGLPSSQDTEGIWHDIWLEETHHSTAIEGNTLVLRQVEQLLDEGRAVGNKQLGEYMEVRGYASAAEWVYGRGASREGWDSQSLLTITEIRHVHALALGPVWEVSPHPAAVDQERPGSFRRHGFEAFPGGMKPPSWTEVPALLEAWLADIETFRPMVESDPGLRLMLPEELARIHAGFEQIHPFLDGNGRTGRLVLNLVLARIGYPPAVIFKRDRSQYLRALRRADADDFGLLGELLARAILHSLYRFIVPALARPDGLVPLPALADEQISANALRVAAIRGRLEATQGADGAWRSSRQWVDEYRASRHKREP